MKMAGSSLGLMVKKTRKNKTENMQNDLFAKIENKEENKDE